MIYPLVHNPFDETDVQVMINSIKSGQFTMGEKVREFETAFARKFNSKYAVMANSGSSANLIAVFSFLFTKLNALEKNCEVLVPAIGWSTTWAPLQQAGFRLKVVDVNPSTLNVDVDSYIEAITEETKMIVTVSILGNPLDFERLRKICDEKKIILFEDNCESIGATVGSKYCGTFGDIGTFSFFYSHHISTIEGGMALTNNEELYHILLSLRAHGWTRELPADSPIEGKGTNELRQNYNFVFPGFNVRPMEMSGALGSAQLLKLDGIVEKRRKNAEIFTALMQKHSGRFSIQTESFGKSSWYSFPIILKSGCPQSRDRLLVHLKNHRIEARMVTGGCLTLHPMRRFFDLIPYKAPAQAERIHNCGLFVANHAVDMKEMFAALDGALLSFRDVDAS